MAVRTSTRRRGATTSPKIGKLEEDVDAVLRAEGLAINQTVENLLGKSKRRVPFGAKRAPPFPRKRPGRAKRLG